MTGVAVRARVEARGLDIGLDIAAGEVVALLGPNGAGKSTVLHVMAGVVHPDVGTVRVGPRVLTDTERGVFVPTHARRVGLLLQDPLLFPHLDVIGNVAFAARSHQSRRAARELAGRWLQEVEASALAARKPHQLSGGQAQRIAIARALAGRPEVLLLDEPMAGLDVGVAATIRSLLRRVLAAAEHATVLVTHDVLDVLTLADRVLVLEAGRVVEAGSVPEVLAAPRSAFAARIAGLNLVHGTLESRAADDAVLVTPDGRRWHGRAAPDVAVGGPAVALFAPAAVAVYPRRPQGSPRNVVALTVAELGAGGSAIRVRAQTQADGAPGLAADVTADGAAELRLVPGAEVWFAVKAQEIGIHAAQRRSGAHEATREEFGDA
ncbi:sulfate/molybdate ABC transporter ATP-binding protein [[Mycobacterium] burgundiense]|uniref:ATP-binding cassette domain-containing protein n=1 Tax=[Mycobacterium] burgundiense TaxID=3064286 RepID=A0ABM9LQT9_9MYCO|nr:ATP-binding cassette domain-containing protein [Mycolicibacterium sp. MU0053]CAJ1503162.1 ATP-binding cassette domain-containing protein [Mycolicibacterium sp. MU0053]